MNRIPLVLLLGSFLLAGCGDTKKYILPTSPAPCDSTRHHGDQDDAVAAPIDSTTFATAKGYALKLDGFGVLDGEYGVLASSYGIPFSQPLDFPFDAPYYHTDSASEYYSLNYGALTAQMYATNGWFHPPGNLAKFGVDFVLACRGVNSRGEIEGEIDLTWGGQRYLWDGLPFKIINWRGNGGPARLTLAVDDPASPGKSGSLAILLEMPGKHVARMSYASVSVLP